MDDVDDKILKLLRLAGQQDNANEAAVARAAAERLAQRHGRDLPSLERAAAARPETRSGPVDDLVTLLDDVVMDMLRYYLKKRDAKRPTKSTASRERLRQATERSRRRRKNRI